MDDLDGALRLIAKHGGEVVSAPYLIENVGELDFFRDTEGNRVGVMQYEATYQR